MANHKDTPAEAKKAALESELAPLYAVAGLTEALAEALRNALAETEGRASQRLSALRSRRPELGKQVKEGADELRTFVITLPDQIKNLPESTRVRLAELQKQANELLAQANTTYGELAGRGKRAVDDAVGSARQLSARTTRSATKATESAAGAAESAAGAAESAAGAAESKAASARRTAAKKASASKTTSSSS
jgi:hypothetical protein